MSDLLRRVLDERSATPPADPARLASLRYRIGVRRRRRVAAAAATVMAVLLVVAGYAVRPRFDPPSEPAGPRLIEGFPEYASGARVVAAGAAPITGEVMFSFPLTSDDVPVFSYCAPDRSDVELFARFYLNDREWFGSSCHPTRSATTLHYVTSRADLGVDLGDIVTFRARVTDAYRARDLVGEPEEWPARERLPLPAGDMAFAIGVPVPFTEYPLPPRPAELPELDPHMIEHAAPELGPPAAPAIRLNSTPGDPRQAVSLPIVWRDGYAIDAVSQTPGILHISLDRTTFWVWSFWDYEPLFHGTTFSTEAFTERPEVPEQPSFEPKAGDTVTVTVTPLYVTGAWQVDVRRYELRR
jgi:hypothetical protein